MATASQYFEALKEKKRTIATFGRWNFPGPPAALDLGGNINFTYDTRLEHDPPQVGDSGTLYTITINMGNLASWSRVKPTAEPYDEAHNSTVIGTGEFAATHGALYPWGVTLQNGTEPDDVNVGTERRQIYDWEGSPGSWVEKSDSGEKDVTASFFCTLLGGGPLKKNDNDNAVGIGVTIDINGDYVYLLPDFDASAFNKDFTRYPWDSSWSSETTHFSDIWTTFLAGDSNRGGTQSLSLGFS